MMAPLKKIAEIPKEDLCRSPEHNPPMHIVLEPGIYEHTCPMCGKVQSIIVNPPY